MTANNYYGAVAAQYDAAREGTPGRLAERAAIAQMVTEGPVLDCPVGTGAFCELYRHLGLVGVDLSDEMLALAAAKHPGLELHRMDLLEGLPFADGQFATAVCIRLLWWLRDGDMQRAMAELRRVSRSVVFSIRVGQRYGRPDPVPGKKQRRTLTHTREQLAEALGSWRVVEDVRIGGGYRVMKAVP